MKKALLAATILAIAAPASAAPLTFSGASTFGVFSGGGSNGYNFGENSSGLITNGGGQVVNSGYMSNGVVSLTPTLINTAATPDLAIDLSGIGSHTFTMYASNGFGGDQAAINLFFDGNANPGISAYSTRGNPSFFALSAPGVIPLNSNNVGTVTGSGTTSYDNGAYTVTLSALTWGGTVSLNNYALGAQTASAGSGNAEAVTFTLDVAADATSVPEPTGLAILTAGLAALGFTRRRARAGA